MIAVLFVMGTVALLVGAAIYAGAFRSPEVVKTWETVRETRAAFTLAGYGLLVVALAGLAWLLS